MIEYVPMSQAEKKLRDEYDWKHSFVRECFIVTSRNLSRLPLPQGSGAVGDSGGHRNARLMISCAGNPVNYGIELLIEGISVYSIESLDELSFDYQSDGPARQLLTLSETENGNRGCFFVAEAISVRFHEDRYLGAQLFLGHEMPSSEAVEANRLENCWRLCSACSNAWEENPSIDFSRCPSCGALTRLTEPIY